MELAAVQAAAMALYTAQQTQVAIAPLTQRYPMMTVEDAYAIQLANVRRMVEAGEIISGKKIGLTSPGIQKQLGVSEPDYGHLYHSMAYERNVPMSGLLQPKIEAEIAFVLKADLCGGQVTAQDVRRATAYVVCAFEIVDSRIADWKIKLPDTVADNASSGRYVLGKRQVPLEGLDLSAIQMRMVRQGDGEVGQGTGAAVMGDPCQSVAWLANCLHRYGVALKQGEVILSGAFSAAPQAKQGDVFTAAFTTLGSVEAQFV